MGATSAIGEGKEQKDYSLNTILKGLEVWKQQEEGHDAAPILQKLVVKDKEANEKLEGLKGPDGFVRQKLTEVKRHLGGKPKERENFASYFLTC